MNRIDSTDTNNQEEFIPGHGERWPGRWFPEGGMVPALLVALVSVASFGVQFGGWNSVVIPVGVIGLVASLFGLIVAKLRLSDSFAHMGGFVLGAGTVFFTVLLAADSLGDGWRDRIRPLGTFLADWYLGRRSPDDHEELLISVLMGLIVWLVGYLASWTLFRRGWLTAAIFLPGLLLIINMAFAPSPRPWLLGVMLAIAIPLGARFHLYQRQRMWARHRMRSPLNLSARVLVITVVLGLTITSLSWQTPGAWSQASIQPILQSVSSFATRSQERAADWLEDTVGTKGRNVENAGSYTAFDDAFSIGGPPHLTDQEEVLVTADLQRAPYLTAHHYDIYTGRGWESGIDDQFQRTGSNGQQYSPELLFRPDQGVVLSSDVTGARIEQTMQVTPLSGQSGVVFTLDTYQSSTIPAVVRMSWRSLDDEPFVISPESLTMLPPDIQLISSLLLQSDLRGDVSDEGNGATDPALQARIDNELAVLLGRLVSVRWEANDAGVIQTLYVSGQLPVYDDVEAVFPRNAADSAVGGSYEVTGLTSTAEGSTLVAAGTEYPGWVTDRYLQLGDTVTPRTIDLALEITREADNPYDEAVLVEEWLRNNIVYDDRVAAPPDDADIVDYVLFENQRGYCEHYSSAMTVMMRALGVPARTVVGYYPGDYDASRDGFLYRQLNAHAWTEVFFPGYGWIPFEPTANRPLSDRDDMGAPAEELPVPTEEVVEPTEITGSPTPLSSPIVEPAPFDDPGPPMLTTEEGSDLPSWLIPAGAVTATVAILGGGLWFAWNWRLRGLPPSSALFARLVRVGRLGGVRTQTTTTPREYASRFTQSLPAAGPAAKRIVQVYELDQYGPKEVDERRLAAAREAWRQVRSLIPRLLFRHRGRS